MSDADKGVTPAGASAGAGQPNTGQAGTASPPDPYAERFSTLDKTLTTIQKSLAEQRSFHDRQLNEIRASLQARGNGGDNGSEGSDTRVATPQFDIARAQRDAITNFKVDYPDWQDYWSAIEEIGSDTMKSRPYTRFDSSGNPDFLASLVAIRSDLELARLRSQKAEWDKSRQEADAQKASINRSAVISGGGSSGGKVTKEIADMTADEMLKSGVMNEFLDTNDMPHALRR